MAGTKPADYGSFDAYYTWDFARFGCLADLLAHLRAEGYGRGFTCDVFGETEDEDLMTLIPSNVVAKWLGVA